MISRLPLLGVLKKAKAKPSVKAEENFFPPSRPSLLEVVCPIVFALVVYGLLIYMVVSGRG